MNGPAHYREAERCLGEATQFAIDTDACHGMHLRAQVHATLALAGRDDELVTHVVSAWTAMSPDERIAARRLSEDLYNALGHLSTVHTIGRAS